MADIKNLVCECFNCKKEYVLNSNSLVEREIEIDGEKLFLKILTCPHCHAECSVQIDNEMTMDLLNKQMLINTTLGKLKVERKSANNYVKQYRKLKQISVRLLQARKELVLKYNGSVYYFQNENKKISINEPVVKITGNSDLGGNSNEE